MSRISNINLKTDVWTSVALDPYLGITCHTVTSDWQMVSFLLHINHFPHPHDHISIKNEFEEVKKNLIDFFFIYHHKL